MNTAKVFANGKSQAVRLPQKYRFNSNDTEVYVKKIGGVVCLFPKDAVRDIFVKSLSAFPEDFMTGDRDQGVFELREDI